MRRAGTTGMHLRQRLQDVGAQRLVGDDLAAAADVDARLVERLLQRHAVVQQERAELHHAPRILRPPEAPTANWRPSAPTPTTGQ
jgi:hypothetical protein